MQIIYKAQKTVSLQHALPPKFHGILNCNVFEQKPQWMLPNTNTNANYKTSVFTEDLQYTR